MTTNITTIISTTNTTSILIITITTIIYLDWYKDQILKINKDERKDALSTF